MAPCTCHASPTTPYAEPAVRTFDAARVALLSNIAAAALPAGPARTVAAAGTTAPARFVQVHVLPNDEGMLLSAAEASDHTATIVLTGSIAGVAYDFSVRITLDGTTISVVIELTKPWHLGPFEWRYDLDGVVRDASGALVQASSIVPSPAVAPQTAIPWCVLRCGGLTLMSVLVSCLPSLVGGAPAYIACVTSKAGAAAAEVAACIARKCL